MADELDPMLESRLRDALHREADAIPFTLRVDTLRRVGTERRRARHARWGSAVAAAAVVAVAVVGLVSLGPFQRGNIAAPTPLASSPATLPSASAADCSPLSSPVQARSFIVRNLDAGLDYGDALSSNAAVRVSDASWPLNQLAPLAAAPDGRIAFDVLHHCVERWDLSFGTKAEVQSALAAGDQPKLQPSGDRTIATEHRLDVAGLPEGDLIIRVVVQWVVASGGSPVVDTYLLNLRVPPSATLPGDSPAPSDATLLAAAGPGAMWLASLDGDAAQSAQVVGFAQFPHRGALAVVVACHGSGTVGVAFADAALPSSDPGGSDSPFGMGSATCDDAPHVLGWDGWNAVGRLLDKGPQVGLSVPPGVAYRAILVDTSVAVAAGEQPEVADGLPTIAHLSGIRADDTPGLVVATHELLDRSTAGGSEIRAADIRTADSLKVLAACLGSSADVAVASLDTPVGGGSSTQYAQLGALVCDGTIQQFEWQRADGPSDAASVTVNASAGTTWRLVVRDTSVRAHPNPSVPCGSTAGLTAAPGSTLYQDGKAIGPVSNYWVSHWGDMSDDGVPVVPTTALDARASVPLELRIDGSACATGWSVVYGTPGSGGMGLDPVGGLALVGGSSTTQVSHENRIDLATLPPGDWVLQVSLSFDKGYGTALVRVHAGLATFRFDVQNRSSTGVIVSVASDVGATMPGFEPGQGGTVSIVMANPLNGFHVEVQAPGCRVLATADYPTTGPMTLVIADGTQPGSIALSTRVGASSTPIPLPSNSLAGCTG